MRVKTKLTFWSKSQTHRSQNSSREIIGKVQTIPGGQWKLCATKECSLFMWHGGGAMHTMYYSNFHVSRRGVVLLFCQWISHRPCAGGVLTRKMCTPAGTAPRNPRICETWKAYPLWHWNWPKRDPRCPSIRGLPSMGSRPHPVTPCRANNERSLTSWFPSQTSNIEPPFDQPVPQLLIPSCYSSLYLCLVMPGFGIACAFATLKYLDYY